ncbi:MAG: helix-hairpin-helix domain-containing protein [Fermentimonas sp.]|nr:helix-hairpin-helix domain-containing protein [Fermentimonas sp.]
MNWKDFFYYNRGTRSAVLLLLILILLTLILNTLLSQKKSSESFINQNDSIIDEFSNSRESQNKKDYSIPNVKPTSSPGTSYTQKKKADGFKSQSRLLNDQSNNFINDEKESSESIESSSLPYTQATNYPRTEKLKAGESIRLNETDTTQWKKIPGIGSVYASRIVKYKNLLGGYVHKEQLMEVYGIDDELYWRIEIYIFEDSNYSKLNINELEFRDLLRHPYLDYEQVKTIVNLRERKGSINSIDELSMLAEFTPEDIERLKPYLQF